MVMKGADVKDETHRDTVSLADAKAHLSELTDRAAHVDAARALAERLPIQPEPASEFVRRMRDGERF